MRAGRFEQFPDAQREPADFGVGAVGEEVLKPGCVWGTVSGCNATDGRESGELPGQTPQLTGPLSPAPEKGNSFGNTLPGTVMAHGKRT